MDGEHVGPVVHLAPFQIAHWNSILEPQGRSKVQGFPVVLYYSVSHGRAGVWILVSAQLYFH